MHFKDNEEIDTFVFEPIVNLIKKYTDPDIYGAVYFQ